MLSFILAPMAAVNEFLTSLFTLLWAYTDARCSISILVRIAACHSAARRRRRLAWPTSDERVASVNE